MSVMNTNSPFPPPDFIPAESAVEGIAVFMPRPEEQEHRPVVQFNCPQCGGQTAYNATDGGLTCTNCDYYEPPQQEAVGRQAESFEFTVETVNRAAHGWGAAREELQCQNCGAYTTLETRSLTHTCPFCGSNKVIQHQAPQEVLRPRFVIPFKLRAEDCRPRLREYLGQSWMVPAVLQQLAQMGQVTGVYIPYWTFSATTDATWRAEVAHKVTERTWDGKKRTKTVWKPESGRVHLPFRDHLVCGTEHLSLHLLQQVNTFDLNELAPYEPGYLAGYQAQAYDVGLEAGWAEARQQMRQHTMAACKAQASSSRMRNFNMVLDFNDETWRHILLPLYLAPYNYGDQRYQVLINGQTGAIAGQRPADWRKVWLAIGAALLPGLLLFLAALVLFLLTSFGFDIASNVSTLVGLGGMVTFLAGLAVGIALFWQAERLDDV